MSYYSSWNNIGHLCATWNQAEDWLFSYMCRQSKHMIKMAGDVHRLVLGRGPDKMGVRNPKDHWWWWLCWLLGVEGRWNQVNPERKEKRKVPQVEKTKRMLRAGGQENKDQCKVSLYVSVMSVIDGGEQTGRREPLRHCVWAQTYKIPFASEIPGVILWSWALENWVGISQIQERQFMCAKLLSSTTSMKSYLQSTLDMPQCVLGGGGGDRLPQSHLWKETRAVCGSAHIPFAQRSGLVPILLFLTANTWCPRGTCLYLMNLYLSPLSPMRVA